MPTTTPGAFNLTRYHNSELVNKTEIFVSVLSTSISFSFTRALFIVLMYYKFLSYIKLIPAASAGTKKVLGFRGMYVP